EGTNLNYVTMAVDEQDNPSESTPREAELQRQLDGLQSQVTDLHKAREATENLELSSEVQCLKEKLDEHSKQQEQSAEKLTQLESENLEGTNLNYVTMAVDEQDNPSESTPREAELQRQLDGLQSQAREATENLVLSSVVQCLEEKLDEHSKQLEQSAEKLTQLESENLVLRDKNQALNIASNKKCLFRTQVRSIPSLDTPNTAGGTAQQPSGEAGASGEKAGDT
ncbi:hypothetical protein HID58_074161, partial [Brassica napus]